MFELYATLNLNALRMAPKSENTLINCPYIYILQPSKDCYGAIVIIRLLKSQQPNLHVYNLISPIYSARQM